MAFLVIFLSPRGPHRPHVILTSSPCHPHRPHIIPIIPTSSPSSLSSPHHPIAPRRSPCGLHGLVSWVPTSSLLSLLSPHHAYIILMSSPHCPHHPHIILMLSPSSPSSSRRPRSPQKVPMWSPWSVVSSCCPVIPTSCPHHVEGLHIISNPPDTHPTHPQPHGGVTGPKSVKMQ